MTDEQRTVGDLDPETELWRCRAFGGEDTAVHFDRDCPRLKSKNPTGQKQAGVMSQDRVVCSFCDPENEDDPQVGNDPRRFTRALEREDVTELDQIGEALEADKRDEEAGA